MTRMALANLSKTIFSLCFALSPGALTLASAACQGEPSGTYDDSICIGDCDDGPAPPISGSAIIDCWVTPASAGSYDTLDCRYEPPLGYPILLAGATISGRSASGDQFSGDITTEQAGRVLSMAHLDPDGYPIEVTLDIRFDESDHSLIALDGLDRVSTKIVVNGAEELSSDRPASAYIPFDLWEINLLGRDADFSALSFGYSLDVGAATPHDVGFKTRPLLFGRTETFYLPVDVNTWAVDAKLVFDRGGSAIATFTGPGNYALRDGDLQSADAADLPQEVDGGSDLASCWFESVGHGFEELYCRATAGRGLKLDGAVIEVVTSYSESARVAVGDEPTLIATLSPRAFPMSVAMVAQIEDGIVGLRSLAGRSLRTAIVMDGKALPRVQSRQHLQAPYIIWEVTVDNQSEGFQGALDAYVLELGDGIYDRFAALIDDAETPFVAENSVTVFSVATPPGVREISGSGFMVVGGQAQDIEFVLRPGTLIVGQ